MKTSARFCILREKLSHKVVLLCVAAALMLSFSWFSYSGRLDWDSIAHREPKTIPLIVAWTKYYSDTISNALKPTMVNCPYECDIVEREDMDDTRVPAAYIFHGRDLNSSDLPRRYPHQLMVMMLFEAPPYSGNSLFEMPVDYFNATMTYRKDSSYPWPYGKFETRRDHENVEDIITEKELQTALPRKRRGALIFVSHCDTHSSRETRIRQLSEVTNITVVGTCNWFYPTANKVKCPKGDPCEDDLIAEHRFYISFENSECKGYITEKFFKRMSQMLVPIVLKRIIYSDEDIPPDSFVALDDFNSYTLLAKHLDMLLHNDSEYMKYFKWTRRYRKPYSYKSDVGCKLCADLHAKKELRVDNIREHFYRNQCGPRFD
ncbi:hypothetical protein ANCCAN_18165 [Ancylostoma caninum]|uniref:Fucosyltransferase n=1 Tax=Ancylostoma caninum TaxID=29170 RepID=A0A368G064_ANCCA|nr:hypothetical protein ANCCAN_18165 [Ancylostoma caninum]